jgi:hypothetical protein
LNWAKIRGTYWRVVCDRKWLRYQWAVMHSGYGYCEGSAWTKRQAERRMLAAIGAFLVD